MNQLEGRFVVLKPLQFSSTADWELHMKTLSIHLDDLTYRLAIARATDSGTTVDELVQEFVALYSSIEDAAARQTFMQWLRDDAERAQDARATCSASRLHVYR